MGNTFVTIKRTALIFGITAQDGILLAEDLLRLGVHVVGCGRSPSIENCRGLDPLRHKLVLEKVSLTHQDAIDTLIKKHRPDEIYNFAAQSLPVLSWNDGMETGEITALGAHRIFESVRKLKAGCRIYQASSSEMYGGGGADGLNEESPFRPLNPYAAAKCYAHHVARLYRDSYGLYIACGILFNHESRYRGMRFLTQKIAYGVACAHSGIRNSDLLNEEGEPIVKNGKLSLGNLDAARDWGYAGDYVRAIHMIMQLPKAEDFVIGTGTLRTVRDLCAAAYGCAGLNWRDHVVSDPRFVRPLETRALFADASKAKRILGWTAKTPIEDVLADMVGVHLANLQAGESQRAAAM